MISVSSLLDVLNLQEAMAVAVLQGWSPGNGIPGITAEDTKVNRNEMRWLV